ncbi:MAG TPA: glycosyltransferase [Actinomycetota bacterium]|jgi:trehalose synthase
MLTTVPVPPRRVDDLIETAGEQAVEGLRAAAAPLAGCRLLQINSTAFGGGVAELLFTQVALLNDLGIDTRWRVIEGSDDFFWITKAIHNALQGAEVPWTPKMRSTYLDQVRFNAETWDDDYDFVIIHDPQPAAILSILEEAGTRGGRWAWRCHIDLTAAFEPVWDFFAPFVDRYDAAVFTLQEFVRPGLHHPRIVAVPPSIDPTSPKNCWLGHSTIYEVLTRYGVDRSRPIALQVSRFDPWKDPLGVIDAYRLAKQEVTDLQLVMIASMASDDPEGMHWFQLTEEHRDGDPDVFLLTNLQGVGNLEVNAFQQASTVIVQKSLREGFGLVVSEGMWKERPVIGGNVGGIRLQIEDGESGFLVDSVSECAERLVGLVADPAERTRMGRAARERVRERFLTPRELVDYLQMLASL